MAAVGIDNDFAAGQAGVSMRAADNELAGGIDMQNEVIVEQCGDFGKQMLFTRGRRISSMSFLMR